MITEQQDRAAANSNKKRQDARYPFLIHTEDGRLIPNTPGNRTLMVYRPYTGKIDASLDERMRWLRTATPYMRRMVNAEPQEEIFDLNTARKDELLDYARNELGMTDVSEDTDLRTLRKQIKERYEAIQSPSLS